MGSKKNMPADQSEQIEKIKMDKFRVDSNTNETQSHEDTKNFETFGVDNSTSSNRKKIADQITEAQRHLDELPESDCRGIPKDFLRKFGSGYLPKWRHVKMPNMLPSPRVIFPLGDSSDPSSLNAILTQSGREHFKNSKSKAAEKSLSEGNKLVFNPKAFDADIVPVTEGEFDCVSILFAGVKTVKDFRIDACALGGAGQFKDLIRRLESKEHRPKILILFDRDDNKSGQNHADELFKKLSEIGVASTIKFFDDFISDNDKQLITENGNKKIDANQILQTRGAKFLRNILREIISHSVDDFAKVEEELRQRQEPEPVRRDETKRENYSVEIQDLINEINTTITPADLEAKGYLKHSERGAARPDGYVCEWCGSGTGRHKTGALKYITDKGEPHFGCGKCGGGGNVITFLAKVWNEDISGKNFFDFLKRVVDEFHISYNPKIFEFEPTRKAVTNAAVIPDDLQEELKIFQEQHGEIDPNILPKLTAAKKFVDRLSPLNFKASFAYEPAPRNKIALCKFYLPSIAQKFFDTLKAARKLSRTILKQISREIAAMEKSGETITKVDLDEITRLSEIAPSKILEEVETVVTALKRKQKHFDKVQHQKADAEAKRATIDAYNANLPWTQNKIQDCPINLVLPASVYFSSRGVGTQTFDERGGIKTREATKSPIVPTKIFRTPKSHVTKYEVAIKTRNQWRHIFVDGNELADARKILRLAKDGGALIKDTKALTDFFAEILAANEDRLPEIPCYTRPGWHGDKFIYPTPTESENYRVERNGIDYDSIFKARGDKIDWLSKFVEVANGKQGALKRIILGACALAPMLKIIKIPNPQFNLWGTSNLGKTPLPKLGLSIYGDPSEGAMLRTWSATAKNMLAMSAGFNCLPLLVDEGETMSRKTQAELSEYVYSYSIGIIGQANKRTGDVRATEKFHGVRFSTAERPLHDTADKRGAFKRLVDLHVTEPLFDDNYAWRLHIFCESNHGHFGRQWTTYIEEHQDEIRKDFERTEKYFAEDGFKRDGIQVAYSSVDATNARAVIACSVAYRHFCACLELEEQFDFVEARDDTAVILAELPTVKEMSDVNRSIRLLASWVDENPRRFITPQKHQDGTPIDDDDRPAETYGSTVGKKFANGDIAFYPNEFRKIIAEIGLPSYEKVLCDLYDADYLDCPSNREKCKVVKIDGKPKRAYVVKSKVFAVDDSENN